MTEKIITGGCLCGAVRFEANKPLYDAHYCHCRTCQKVSGAPAIAGAFVSRDAFRFTTGEPKLYRSSPVVERGFCADCGTYLMYRPLIAEWSDWLIITIASLDDPESVPPEQHYGVESKMSWFNPQDDLPHGRYEDDFVDILSGVDGVERKKLLKQYGPT